MKLLLLAIAGFASASLCASCTSEENGYYTPSQMAAQHAGYDPTHNIESGYHY